MSATILRKKQTDSNIVISIKWIKSCNSIPMFAAFYDFASYEPSVIFSPASGGSVKPSIVIREISKLGMIKLNP